jgi:hypothetical protein
MFFIKSKISKDIKKLASDYLKLNRCYILPEEGNIKPNVSHINNGYCAQFASDIIKLYPSAEYYWEEYKGIPHAFVKYNNKYYDSESPNGVLSWKDLPIFKE